MQNSQSPFFLMPGQMKQPADLSTGGLHVLADRLGFTGDRPFV